MYVLTCLLFWGDNISSSLSLQIRNATIALLQPRRKKNVGAFLQANCDKPWGQFRGTNRVSTNGPTATTTWRTSVNPWRICVPAPLLNSGRGRSQSSALLGEKKTISENWMFLKLGRYHFNTGIYVVYSGYGLMYGYVTIRVDQGWICRVLEIGCTSLAETETIFGCSLFSFVNHWWTWWTTHLTLAFSSASAAELSKEDRPYIWGGKSMFFLPWNMGGSCRFSHLRILWD